MTRPNWRELLAPLSDGEIREVETRLGPMRVLDVERAGRFVLLHGRGVLTGHAISVAVKATEVDGRAA